MSDVLTMPEVCKALRCRRQYVDVLILQGKLHPFKVGRLRAFTAADVAVCQASRDRVVPPAQKRQMVATRRRHNV